MGVAVARGYSLVFVIWLVAAIGVGLSGLIERLSPPAPQGLLLGLTILPIVAALLSAGFRSWLAGLGLRRLVAYHLVRFVGIWFLVLHRRGELPWAFAVPGGWGDIAIAMAALGIVLLVPDLLLHPRIVLGWNLLGLIDILAVVATAARLAFADPASMSALLRFPLNLLLTFIVPITIGTHLLIAWRYARRREGAVPA